MRISPSAHTWIFPLVMMLGALVSGYRALTGDQLVGRNFWRASSGAIKVQGWVGLVAFSAIVVYWFVEIGPAQG